MIAPDQGTSIDSYLDSLTLVELEVLKGISDEETSRDFLPRMSSNVNEQSNVIRNLKLMNLKVAESNVSTKEMIDNLLADYEQSKSNLEIQSNLYQDKINLYVSKRNEYCVSGLAEELGSRLIASEEISDQKNFTNQSLDQIDLWLKEFKSTRQEYHSDKKRLELMDKNTILCQMPTFLPTFDQ